MVQLQGLRTVAQYAEDVSGKAIIAMAGSRVEDVGTNARGGVEIGSLDSFSPGV